MVIMVPEVPLLHEEVEREAESLKKQGNRYYDYKDYNETYNSYSNAINIFPKNSSDYRN